MFAQGLLAADEVSGEWTAAPAALEAGKEFPVSRTVQDVIAERVDRLPEELGEVLITVAVAGGPGCRPDVLSHVHGISRLHAAAVCDALAERRLLVEGAGVYRCLHPVIAHVVRDRLTPDPAAGGASGAGRIARGGHARPMRGASPERSRATPSRAATGGSPTARRCSPARVLSQRFAFAEALSWLDLASSVAADRAETDEVDRRTAALMETGGWSEVPAARGGRSAGDPGDRGRGPGPARAGLIPRVSLHPAPARRAKSVQKSSVSRRAVPSSSRLPRLASSPLTVHVAAQFSRVRPFPLLQPDARDHVHLRSRAPARRHHAQPLRLDHVRQLHVEPELDPHRPDAEPADHPEMGRVRSSPPPPRQARMGRRTSGP